MASVHRLQEVERLRSADFADDDPFGPHTQTVAHEVAHGDLTLAFKVWRARFQPYNVRLLQLQFRRVFARDDAFVVVDELRKAVKQRGLAGAGAARDQGINAAAPDDAQNLGALRRNRAESDELIERQLVLFEFADRECRSVDRKRRNNRVDARTVRQAGVADRRGFVDPPADLADDSLADVQQLLIVAKANSGLLDLSLDFDVDRTGPIDHDVGDIVARKQRLERAEAKDVIADIVEQVLLLRDRHHDVLDRDDLVDDVADFLACGIDIEPGQLRQVDRLDQRAENGGFGLVIRFRSPRIDGSRGGRGRPRRNRR